MWISKVAEFPRRWIDDSLTRERMVREGRWSEAIAIGNLNFVVKVKSELGFKAARLEMIDEGGTYALREESEAYGSNLTDKNEALSSKNTRFERTPELKA